jgi:type IV pilus assembly protein PilW
MAGASLLEVLVAMGLGVALTLVMATVHARILFMSADAARAADAQDTLRIALAVLEYELQHAGFWGLVADAEQISGRRGDADPLAVTVSGDCGPDWTIDLDRSVEAWASGWPLSCSPFGGAAPASAVLVLRRADTRETAPDAGVLQLLTDPWTGRLNASGESAAPGTELRDLVVRAYYVSPRSTADASRPSLRRKTLQRGPRIVDEEVVPGIAAFELAMGIDTDPPGAPGHGMPNQFVAPGAASGAIVAVRVMLRADDPSRLPLVRTIPLRNGPAT